MLRLCKTLIRHILHKKPTVDVNALNSHLVDAYGWVHHGYPYRIYYLLPALYHLECIINGHVSIASGFMMPKTKRKSKHKKSKHSRRHKKAKYSVPEIIELSSSSSDNESDIAVVFDLKQERLRKANENVIYVPDSDSEDTKCGKITRTQVDLSNDTENVSNKGYVKKKRETITTDMGNTVSEGTVLNNVQNLNVDHEQVQSFPVNYPYDFGYGYGNVCVGNMPAAVCLSSYMQTEINNFAEDVYPSSNAQTEIRGTCAETTSSSWSSMFHADQPAEDTWDIVNRERSQLKKKRYWVTAGFSKGSDSTTASQLLFKIMSYNVLAQDLIHQHDYLYQAHDPRALSWEVRSQILISEIKEADAQILCLQEVQQSHLDTFYKQLDELGYNGIYKRRTGNNVDGVAIYYKTDVFELVDYTTVEYFQPNVDRLNRDNVGLVAKLACKANPNKHLVVATTHLLFNPRRHDVKLSQIQVLLAEVERFAFDSFRHGKSHYWPVIITGDMNFLPYTGVYRLLVEGSFQYEGRCSKTLAKHSYFSQTLDKTLLPDSLQITDTCQHWGILCNRMVQKMDHKAEIRLLKIHNSDHQKLLNSPAEGSANENKAELKTEKVGQRDAGLDTQNMERKETEVSEPLRFGTGKLSHPFHFCSVYTHGGRRNGEREVTTNQKDWVTVDYIFYSVGRNKEEMKIVEDELKLTARYKLLKANEAEVFGPIPNFASPSDHYPLLAQFSLKT